MLKLVRYSADAYTIQFNGEVVASILLMSNDKYALFDKNDNRIMRGVLTDTVAQAFNKFKEVFNVER